MQYTYAYTYRQIHTQYTYIYIQMIHAYTIRRAGGTPGWLWNLRPGSLV
jgi:hypothetical protein